MDYSSTLYDKSIVLVNNAGPPTAFYAISLRFKHRQGHKLPKSTIQVKELYDNISISSVGINLYVPNDLTSPTQFISAIGFFGISRKEFVLRFIHNVLIELYTTWM